MAEVSIAESLKDEILKFSANELYNNNHNANYDLLKNKFAEFYGFPVDTFSWKQFSDILKHYNAFDTQILLGPVLRAFMKDKMDADKLAAVLKQGGEAAGLGDKLDVQVTDPQGNIKKEVKQ